MGTFESGKATAMRSRSEQSHGAEEEEAGAVVGEWCQWGRLGGEEGGGHGGLVSSRRHGVQMGTRGSEWVKPSGTMMPVRQGSGRAGLLSMREYHEDEASMQHAREEPQRSRERCD